MNARWIVAAALLAAGNTAHAQESAPSEAPVAVPMAAVRFPLAVRFPIFVQAAEQAADPAPQAPANREDIRAMEALLTNALQKGAQDLALRMQVNDPGSRFVTGTGRARGFALDGYGVFFDVDVPGMKQSLVWSAELLRQMQQADYLRQFIASNPDSNARQFAMSELARLERQLNGARLPQSLPPVQQMAPADRAVAQAVNETTTMAMAPVAPNALVGRNAAAAPVASDLRDPNELYTDAVKNALIDAMLKYSGFLKIGADEWLTVAARDSEGPAIPGQIDEASTIIIRIKGSDLAAFQSNRLTREEVLKKVQVKEF
ncbi:MAG TPA: hypothetical protein VKH34_14290 [Vicinamibacterales bacterium]|nr:hypothetical protein [Vicinamibacterales bacterium]